MASLLNNLCIGQYQATMLVFTRLNQSCQPLAGQNDQVRTSCFASVDAQPQYDDGIEYGRRSSDGLRCFYVRDCNKFKQIDLTIQIVTWDMELLSLSTGSTLFTGKTGTPYAGKSMGFGVPGGDDACPSGVAVEVYTKAAYGTGGFCVTTSAGAPVYVRHLFPFARLQMGQITSDDNNDGILLNLTGFGLPNANWGNGPNNDWPSSVDMADNSPYAAVFTNLLPDSTCGYTTPTSTALNEAVFWIDADDVTDTNTSAPNRGTGGSALNAVYGTILGLDVGDPKWLPGDDRGGYLYQPGTANSANFMSMPDAGTTFTADMSIALRYDPDSRATSTTLVQKRSAAIDGALSPFNFTQGLTAGALGFVWYDSTGTLHQLYTATTVPVSAKWVGVQHDINNGAGGNTARFYWSNDGSAWTLLATVTEAFAGTTRRANAADIGVGGNDAGVAGTAGLYREVKIWNSLTFEGTPQRHINMATDVVNEGALATFTCTSGQTVTVNRSTSGRKAVVTRVSGKAKWLFGTDDYMEVPDNALLDFVAGESFTMMVVVRQWPTATAYQYMGKGLAVPSAGWSVGVNTASMADGTNQVVTSALTVPTGILTVVATVRDVVADTVTRWLNGTTVSGVDVTTGTSANALPLRIGRSGTAAAEYQDFIFVAAAVWRRALTTTELTEIQAFYGATGTV